MTRARVPYRALTALIAAASAGCNGFQAGQLFSGTSAIQVREVGRSLYCQTPTEESRAVVLPDLQAVLDWQADRGVTLAPSESLVRAPYAVVEMGLRPTGGYGVAIARNATLTGDLVTLQGTFVSPAPGSLRTQAQSSPCVLVQLPPGRYGRIAVQDPAGEVRARGTAIARAAPTPPAVPLTLPPGPSETGAAAPLAAPPSPAAAAPSTPGAATPDTTAPPAAVAPFPREPAPPPTGRQVPVAPDGTPLAPGS